MEQLKVLNSIAANDDENQQHLDVNDVRTTSSLTDTLRQSRFHHRILQNFRLVWLDNSTDQTKDDNSINITEQLQKIVNNVTKFTDTDTCIEFITNVRNEKIFFICSEEFGQTIIPIIHENSQVYAIYLFSTNQLRNENWVTPWFKIKGTYTDYDSIYKALKNTAKFCDDNLVSISFIKKIDGETKQDLDTIDSSFMYTQIMKEILLTIDFQENHINEFLSYCREQFVDNTTALKNVDLIQKEYRTHQPIWWYTYDCFLYSMLNRALRLMEVDLIIKMGFFLKDLHNHITTLHATQFGAHHHSNSFIVYRGQGLSQTDFDKLQQIHGGLLSFNNFLSTSLDRTVAFAFAESIQYNSDMIGVIFQITINSAICSSQFANVTDVSYYEGEGEILFSMHSTFRIGQIEQIDENLRLWQVDLILTSDNDPQLQKLTEFIREETLPAQKGWYRLGELLIKLDQYDKAQQVCDILLLEQTTDEKAKGDIYHILGMIKKSQGKYEEAIQHYEQSIQITEKFPTPTHLDLAASYDGLGLVYSSMGEYSKALSYCEKALEISRKTLSENHPYLATSYNSIGAVYHHMKEYSKTILYYEKALAIDQKNFPENHPKLATTYNNIGLVYHNIGEYSKALSHYEKVLKIYQKTLFENHSDSATYYNNIGGVHFDMGEYSKALPYFEQALKITQKALSENHPSLATFYDNIGKVYKNLGEYSKALSYLEKALGIRQKTLPPNHLKLTSSYNNIGVVYADIGKYSKALSYYEKSLEILEKILPENHLDWGRPYNNIGTVYNKLGEYSKALSYHEKALEIMKKSLPKHHPLLANFCNNIGSVYDNMKEYAKSLTYYQTALEILEKPLLENHPYLATSYNNIGLVYYNMGENSKALSYCEKALEMKQKIFPENHPQLACSYNNIGLVYNKLGEYSKALSYHEKTLEILEKTLPENHPHFADSYSNVGEVYKNIEEYSKALSYYKRALDIRQRSLPPEHPDIEQVKESIETVTNKL